MDTLLAMFQTAVMPHRNLNCANLMSAVNKMRSFCSAMLLLVLANPQVSEQFFFGKNTVETPQLILQLLNPSAPEFGYLA